MNIQNILNWLEGKKTKIGMLLLFVYGGLAYIGFDFMWLRDLALIIGGVGLAHGAWKAIK